MASPDRVVTNEFQLFLPVLDQETVTPPNTQRPHRALRLSVQLLALASFATACSGGGDETITTSSNESVPALTTTTTIPAPTTELTPTTTVPTPTTEMETTTSIVATETTAVQVDINNAALCEQERDPRNLSPDSFFGQAGVPNLDKLEFYGDCTGLPGDLDWFWGYPGGSGYIIDIDTTGFKYNARGEHFSELVVGRPDIPWNERHPEFGKYGAMTLLELITGVERGDPVCWYIGTEERYAQNLTFSRVALATHYNKYTKAEPKTHVAIFFLNPDGTEDPYYGWADGMGVMQDANTGAWVPSWIKPGECVDLSVAA